jgi:hypothetical protein
LKLFYLQGREFAPLDWTVMLDEAQDADPVILGLLERHKGARIIVGEKYQQLYRWREAVNALSRMRSDSAELSLTRTFRFGSSAAEWANRVLEIIGEKLRITPAPHQTIVRIEEKSLMIDALLARTNAGTLDFSRAQQMRLCTTTTCLTRTTRATAKRTRTTRIPV